MTRIGPTTLISAPSFGRRPQAAALENAHGKPVRFHRLTPEEQGAALMYAEAAGDGVLLNLLKELKPAEQVAYLHTRPWQQHSPAVLESILPRMTPRQRDEYLHGKRLQDAFSRLTSPMMRLANLLDTRVWRAKIRHNVALWTDRQGIMPYSDADRTADDLRQLTDLWMMIRNA